MAKVDEKDREIQRNYEAFKKQLPDLLEDHLGKFALMRGGKVVEFFDTPRDALLHGQRTFDDNLFSVQEVTEAKVDLGWFSRAPTHASV